MLPIPSQPTGNFIQDVCDGRPDLYGSCRAHLLPPSACLSSHVPCFLSTPGPFWTLTTLAFTLYVFSSLSTSISAYLANPDIPPVQDIGKISFAAALVYSYGLGFPALLWAVVRWLGGAEVGWGVVEALVIYGCELARLRSRRAFRTRAKAGTDLNLSLADSMSIYIPISVLCIIPIPILRWILVGLGAGSSGWFL